MVELRYEEQRAVVSVTGAALRAYDVGGRPVVEAFDGPDAPSVGCAGEVLMPWPNRVVDGRWSWRGRAYRLPVNETDHGHALHGLVRALRWEVAERSPERVALAVDLPAREGWPFPMRCAATYALGPGGLVSTLTATNLADEPCPYGVGVHPYLAVPGGAVDAASVELRAATRLETDARLAPARRSPAEPLDPVGDRVVDNAFTDLERRPDGRVEAALRAPDGRTTVLWGDETVRWWQLFTGDTLPEPWRRRTVALEPMTCAPDALNTGDGLVVLSPGAAHAMTWGLTLR